MTIQIGREIGRARITSARLLGHGLQADGLEVGRDRGLEDARRIWVLDLDPYQHQLIRTQERPGPGQQLVQDHSQAVDVGPGVD